MPLDITWTIPGRAVEGYVDDSSAVNLLKLRVASIDELESEDFKQSQINFYWVDGGTKNITVVVTAGVQQESEQGAFTAERPSATLSASTTSVQVDNPSNPSNVGFGNFLSNDHFINVKRGGENGPVGARFLMNQQVASTPIDSDWIL